MIKNLEEALAILESDKKYSRMSELVAFYQNNEDKTLLNKLLSANEKLIISLLMNYKTNKMYEDLFQESRIGLYRAIETYDYGNGYKFSTYAAFVIKRRIYNFLNKETIFYIPDEMQSILHKIDTLEKNGIFKDEDILKNIKGLSLEKLKEAKELKIHLDYLSFDTPINKEETDSLTLIDIVPDRSVSDLSKSIITKQEHDAICDIIHEIALHSKRLKDPETLEYVVKKHFGIDYEQASITEIAKDLNIPKRTVANAIQDFIRIMKSPKYKILLRTALGVPYSVPDRKILDYMSIDEKEI